jgi:hypothetical protein
MSRNAGEGVVPAAFRNWTLVRSRWSERKQLQFESLSIAIYERASMTGLRWLMTMIVVSGGVPALICSCPEAQEPDKDAIFALYSRSVDRIRSVEIQYRMSFEASPNYDPPVALYARDGEKYLICDDCQQGSRSGIDSWNGSFMISQRYWKTSERPIVNFFQRQVHSPRFEHAPDQLIGHTMFFSHPSYSLKKVIKENPFEFVGFDALEGRSCWKFCLPELISQHGFKNRLFVWFDPERDHLPAKMQYLNENDKVVFEFTIKEFRRVVDGESGEEIWFPFLAVLSFGSGLPQTTTSIVDVQLNRPIDEDRFDPLIPPGTVVRDADAQVDLTAGGSAAAEQRIAEIVDEAQDALRPRGTTHWVWTAAGVVALVAIGFFVGKRRSE